MKKTIPSLLLLFGLLPSQLALAQDPSEGAMTAQDSAALEQGIALAEQYADHLDRYFNQGASADADFTGSFMALFSGSQKIIADYSISTWRLESAEYLFEAGQIFGEDRPHLDTEVDRAGAEVRYFPNDRFHIAVVPVTNRFSMYFDQAQGAIIADTLEKYLTLEIRIGAAENARINRTFEREPAVVLATALALADEKSAAEESEKAEDEKTGKEAKEPKPEKQPKGPKVAKAPKPTKEPKAPREPRERRDLDSDRFLLAGLALGGDLGMANIETLEGPFRIEDHSFQQTDFALTYFHPISDNGLFVSAGLGLSLGRLTLDYENTSYSFEEDDPLNPAEETPFAGPADVGQYERTVSLQGVQEHIEFGDFNFRLGLGKDLMHSKDDLLMVGAGVMVGFGYSQTSEVRAISNYHGRFTEINGLPIDLTLGLNEDIPEYGFEERSTENAFEMDTGINLGAFFHALYAKSLGDKFYVGIQVEVQAPLSDWKEGTGTGAPLFRTFDDIQGSISNQVSTMKRPVFFGGGLVVGIKF